MLKAAKNLRELRIHLCTNSSNSDGVRYPYHLKFREFLVQNYQNLKKQNPSLPILVRESAGVEAIAYYRFGNINLNQERASRNLYVSMGLESIKSRTFFINLNKKENNESLADFISFSMD
jgi:hypothetical protein